MPSKRASSTGPARPAFGGRPGGNDHGDDDDAAPAAGCRFCSGHWLPGDVFEHDAACVAAGRAVMASRARRRLNGLD
jgi:hypothetical protein